MGIDAIVWAQDDAPIDDQVASFVLNALARSADSAGRNAYPSKDTIMWRTRLSESSVKRALRTLRKEGLIRLGDQNLVAHVPADRRPTVWDLDMTRKRPPRPVSPGRRGSDLADGGPDRPPVDADGGSVGPERGVTETGTGGLSDPQESLRESDKSPLSRPGRTADATGGDPPNGHDKNEREDLIEWIKKTKPNITNPRAYLTTVTRNGDYTALVAEMRATKTGKTDQRKPWCGQCSGEKTRRVEIDGRPARCHCHPLYGQPLARST